MCPSYCHVRVPFDEAVRRFAEWQQTPQPSGLIQANVLEAHKLAVHEGGGWKGNVVFVSDLGEWTLFNDMSGCLSGISAESWLVFAKSDDLVFAGYNDAVGYAELVVIEAGKLIRAFIDYAPESEANIDVGDLGSAFEPLESWIDVASIVDEDELGFRDEGWLWVY